MKMRRDEQIRAAQELLAPPPKRRQECKDEIEAALNHIVFSTRLKEYDLGPLSKEKRAVDTMISTLRSAKAAYNSLREFDHVPDIDIDFNSLIKPYDEWLARQPVGPRHRTSIKQQKAAREALSLILKFVPQELDKRSHKIKFKRRASATRGGLWCELAAMLYGDKKIDMLNQVRRAQQELREIEKTFRSLVTALGK